jgi:hypothetical protein
MIEVELDNAEMIYRLSVEYNLLKKIKKNTIKVIRDSDSEIPRDWDNIVQHSVDIPGRATGTNLICHVIHLVTLKKCHK